MLNKKEFETKNKNKSLYTIHFPANSYAQIKSGEDTHFMSCDKKSDDNFIELTEDGIKDLFSGGYLCNYSQKLMKREQ
ncbi:hypothetical protein [Fructilactobacillus sanfranciscensis]|uniref:hypothetical protein n=1 Tax=Fructilactobacillus sanfranciscensis TaxID=1625 RepID=UPI0013D49DF6|nr:hypothetical protein [Fructilactobacillus sanfranciscensis]NDR97409.1 hypothetical protein [Fructilactobacillus sanfranciscensis]